MKLVLAGLILTFSTLIFAQDVVMTDFKDWKLTDVASQGYSKEKLFSNMNRDFIKLGGSICSNRALIWSFDFKRNQNVDAGKVFLFYTRKNGEIGQKTWWYHVAPIINEKGVVYAMDAGFPSRIKSPITAKEWLKKFSGSTKCKEIQSNETDLVTRMFDGYVFPETTSYGTHDCYFKFTPAGYWTPSSVAMGLLGKDSDGNPISYVRDEINTDEVYAACVEAVTSPLGRVLGGGKKSCKKYIGL
jgi:hypothetical protein